MVLIYFQLSQKKRTDDRYVSSKKNGIGKLDTISK
jgi:hypothetical protein